MTELANKNCEACRAGAPKIEEQQLAELIADIPNWTPIVVNDVMRLERSFKFKNFVQAMAFSNKVGEMAEIQGHHPAILTEWGKVTVTWWTHKIKGLHVNDFICAAKTDTLV